MERHHFRSPQFWVVVKRGKAPEREWVSFPDLILHQWLW